MQLEVKTENARCSIRGIRCKDKNGKKHVIAILGGVAGCLECIFERPEYKTYYRGLSKPN